MIVKTIDTTLLARLRDLLGDRVSTGDSVRDHHSRGESI